MEHEEGRRTSGGGGGERDSGGGVVAVACGAWHTAALTATGDVYAWGWSRFGQCAPAAAPAAATTTNGDGEDDGGDDDGDLQPAPRLVCALDDALDVLGSDDEDVDGGGGDRWAGARSRADDGKRRRGLGRSWCGAFPSLSQRRGRRAAGGLVFSLSLGPLLDLASP